MEESREFKGIWYLPNNRDNAVAGILYYRKKEIIRLELIGSLSNQDKPIKIFFEDNLRSPQIIYGESSDAKKITLISCEKGEQSLNLSCTFPLTSFICQYIVIGSHISNKDEKCFNKIRVKIPVLSRWLIPTLIEDRFLGENDLPSDYELKIPLKQKTNIEVEINSNFKLSLISRSSFSGSLNYPDELKINQFTLFEIESISGKVSLPELLDQSYLFIHFVSLASLTKQEPTEIYLYDYDDFQTYNGENVFNSNEIIYIIRNKDLNNEKINLLFKYNKIETEFPEIIKKWYSVSNDLAPIRNHLFNSIQRKSIFTSLDFLIVVQALEGYHRRFVSFQKKGRITLKDRLEDLIQIYSSHVLKINNSNLIVQVVVDTRDYYSHFFARNTKPNLIEGIELLELTMKLRLLLICCVLDLIGFTKQKINNIVERF